MALALAVPLSLRLVGDGAQQSGYQSLLAAGGPSSVVIIEEPGNANPAAFAGFQQRTAQLVEEDLHGDLELSTTYARAGSFWINTLNGRRLTREPGDSALTAASYPDLQTHAALIKGVWPDGNGLQSPIAIALSQAGASLTGLNLGDIACVGTSTTTADRSWCVKLAGIWRPNKPSEPYWQSGPSNTDMTLSTADYYQFLGVANRAARGDVRSGAGRSYQPDPTRFTFSEAPALVDGLRQLRGAVEIQRADSLITSLDHTVQTYLERSRANRFPIQLVGAGLLLVVVYALALLSQNYLDAQLQQSLLWRTRGWRRERLAGFLLLQLCILVVPAVVVALALGLAGGWLLLRIETGSAASLAAGLGNDLMLGIAVGLALVLIVEVALTVRFSRRDVLEMRRAIARPSSVAWWRWRNLDVALAVLAIPLLAEAQLRSQVAVRTASPAEDLVGLVLPVAAMALLGLVGLRLLPLFAHACDIAPKSLAARLSWLRMRRQPTEHAGLALLLALTVALGAFAGVYSATERQNIVDRTAYGNGAGILVRYLERAPRDAMAADLQKIGHVASATPVLRQTVYLANSAEGITALGVDPVGFPATAWTRPGLTTPELGPALARLAQHQSDGAIPALMSEATMSRLGIKNGFDASFYAFNAGTQGFRVKVLGALDYVPTLYPGSDDFMVMPLDQALAGIGGQTFAVAPNELWLNVHGDHGVVVAALRRDPYVAFVQDLAAEQAGALADPLFLELRANLAVGVVTASALASLAFTVHFLMVTRRRLSEHAILDANGLEPSVVRTGLAIEQMIVVLFALAVGGVLAATLSLWVLPSLQLGSSVSDLIPPTILHAEWQVLGLGAVSVLAIAGVLAWAIRRAGTAVDTVEELRRLG